MTLPWVRIDSNIATHDKILDLLHDPRSPAASRWRAAFSYVCAIGWSADQGTDGAVPRAALPFIHGTSTTARLLVDHQLWEPNGAGWTIHNYALRQELATIAETKRHDRTRAGERGACARWHGPDCWGPDGCSRT